MNVHHLKEDNRYSLQTNKLHFNDGQLSKSVLGILKLASKKDSYWFGKFKQRHLTQDSVLKKTAIINKGMKKIWLLLQTSYSSSKPCVPVGGNVN